MKRTVGLLLSLCAACGGTKALGPSAVGLPPPPLPAGAVVPKWDHSCTVVHGKIEEGQVAELSRLVDHQSDDGWELVGWSIGDAETNLACFKRPRANGASAATDAPPARTTFPKWDHFCTVVHGKIEEGQIAELSRLVDYASNDGWELVGWSVGDAQANLACFKRPRLSRVSASPAER